MINFESEWWTNTQTYFFEPIITAISLDNNDTSSHTVHYHIGWQPIHTHTHACTHAHTHARTHTHTHTCTHTHTHNTPHTALTHIFCGHGSASHGNLIFITYTQQEMTWLHAVVSNQGVPRIHYPLLLEVVSHM